MNWLDVLIVLVVAYFAYQGFRSGFLVGLLELLGVAVSLVVPFVLYGPFSRVLEGWGVSRLNSGAVAFLILWFLAVVAYFAAARRIYQRIPGTVRASTVNRTLGVLPGAIKGTIVVAMLVTLAAVLPVPLVAQNAVDNSALAAPLLNATTTVSAEAESIFGGAVHNALGFLTIEPGANERITLPTKCPNPVIDPEAEKEMLAMLNRERTSRGLQPLIPDPMIREVARKHSEDMLKRGYFSHDTPEGVTPFQRMSRGGVRFLEAGENIAYAPTTRIAHEGLMKSPGHRANILRPSYRRVGIGVAKGGRCRMMFTQDFAR